MEDRNLEKALDIMSKLINGEEISRNKGENISLYEEYASNAEVYDILHKIFKKMNLNLYEYNYGLYITAGENNKIFGYSNADLKKALGVKLNRELYLCYFIIYHVIMRFYNDTASYTYAEYLKLEDIVTDVEHSLAHITENMEAFALNEVEENSFEALALLWEDMPAVNSEDSLRATRTSKSGYVKTVLNFLIAQELLAESEERYYPKERFKALAENYFEEYRGRLYEIMNGREDAGNASY